MLTGCGMTRTNEGASPPQSKNVIERTAEKGPVKMFVRVWPKEPRLSDLVEMDVRESSPGPTLISNRRHSGRPWATFSFAIIPSGPQKRVRETCAFFTINWSRYTLANT